EELRRHAQALAPRSGWESAYDLAVDEMKEGATLEQAKADLQAMLQVRSDAPARAEDVQKAVEAVKALSTKDLSEIADELRHSSLPEVKDLSPQAVEAISKDRE